MNIDDFVKVPISKLTSPQGGGLYFIYHNMYWAVTENNELLFFRKGYTSPQCNSNKQIVQDVLCKNIGGNFRVELIEYVYIPKEEYDYKDW